MWLRYALIGLLVAGAWLYVRAEAHYASAIAQCGVDAARSDEQIAQARLSMLEAQIEPHFLFNTLAHVKRLYELDPSTGRRMVTSLIDYLAVALPQMRETRSTLGREVAHATAYLDIQRMRMGPRLGIDIDVPEALRDADMPPLMILTLVENAIKHGVGPQPGGGHIAIRAWDAGGSMNVEVADTGQGFAHTSGAGTGLANIRNRLAALFGREASLSLRMNTPHGVVATIVLPRPVSAKEKRDEYRRAA
jgi:LytS/YehU family sensor histidine kinase